MLLGRNIIDVEYLLVGHRAEVILGQRSKHISLCQSFVDHVEMSQSERESLAVLLDRHPDCQIDPKAI